MSWELGAIQNLLPQSRKSVTLLTCITSATCITLLTCVLAVHSQWQIHGGVRRVECWLCDDGDGNRKAALARVRRKLSETRVQGTSASFLAFVFTSFLNL